MPSALPSLLSHTYCLAGTLLLPLLRHNLAQIRAASSPSILDPHIHPQIPGREPHKWLLYTSLPSRAVLPNRVPTIPAWCSVAFHPPQCHECLLSHIFTQLCCSPFSATCCQVPLQHFLCCHPREGKRLRKSWVHVLVQWEKASAKHQVPEQACMGS